MENWRVAILSSAITVAVILIIVLINLFIQSGIIDVIKEDLINDYCSSIPLSEARELEVCNE
ncbi:MAG TPA: hypothetical protein IAB45_03395 [Candidatus Onthousia faecavium]|nr:hypothetical protein [Candidatus Onthousia faecavium]